MENLHYIIFTNIVIALSFTGLVVIVTKHAIRNKKFRIRDYVICLLLCVGIYLYFPYRYTYLGYTRQDAVMLNKAIKLSINPYEKRLCYSYLAGAYINGSINPEIKDGNKAIEYMEKAINGKYEKYPSETNLLAYWYSIKGDYKKTLELCAKTGTDKGLPLRNAYILSGEYEKAANSFLPDDISIDNFLKAALYKKIGNLKEAAKAEKVAQETYNAQIKAIPDEVRKAEYREYAEKYKSIDKYKNWLKEQAKDFGFN